MRQTMMSSDAGSDNGVWLLNPTQDAGVGCAPYGGQRSGMGDEVALIHENVSMDLLTGARTRGQLFDQVEAAFADQRSVVLLVANVDHCIHMNGSLGFKRVDEYLCDVAELLALTAGRAVYRVGGDEFVVLFCDLAIAQQAAEQLRAAAEVKFSSLGDEVRAEADGAGIAQPVGPVATLSFGISTAGTATELLQRADEACQQAKVYGRNCVSVYGLNH